jgi:hypothetical protein
MFIYIIYSYIILLNVCLCAGVYLAGGWVEVPRAWVTCCVDFLIASSVYEALHPAITSIQRTVLILPPPLTSDFALVAQSHEQVNHICRETGLRPLPPPHSQQQEEEEESYNTYSTSGTFVSMCVRVY